MNLTHDEEIRKRLRDIIKHMDHVLPGQAPIKDFVHHNTIHGFQHLHFTEALKAVHKMTGTYGYMTQDDFVDYYRQGRISKDDLRSAINADDELNSEHVWLEFNNRKIKLEDIYFAATLYGKKSVSCSRLSWLIEEKDMLQSLLPYIPNSSRDAFLAGGKKEPEIARELWEASLDVLNLDMELMHPEELADLSPEFAEDLIKKLASETQAGDEEEHKSLHRIIRKESDRLRKKLWSKLGKEYTLRGLLKALTGHDILDDYRPVLLRHLASYLDQGVASWHHAGREQGFFISWRESAKRDLVKYDNELPDWKDELEGLPDDPLEAIIWELDHLGLTEDEWDEYLERIALELPGWSGMFLWLHNHPGYDGMKQPVDMMDYLAVRLVFERIYAQRLTRRKWHIESSLHAIHWYFHRHRSELYVRYELYNGNLPEFLASRANRLSIHDASFADKYSLWQQLADLVWTWKQSNQAGTNNHYLVYQHGWQLFRLMQILGVPAKTIKALNKSQLQTFFAALDKLDENKTGYLWLQAYERHYRERFFNAASQNVQRGNWRDRNQRPEAQIIFCMDEREEGIRRHLETLNPLIETLGAAAHFNVPHRWKPLDDINCTKLSPVTIDPVHEIHETPVKRDIIRFTKHQKRHEKRIFVEDSLNHEIRRNLLSSSMLIALSAPVTLATLTGKVFVPLVTGQLLKSLRQKIDTSIDTNIDITAEETKADATPDDPSFGFSIEEQVTRISGFLRTNGLADGFGNFIVIMGHGSTNENNPHRSAYGCGACSGKYSGPNARILAKVGNNPRVRESLREEGIDIPDDCWLIGAQHNTCSEEIDWYDTNLIPESLKASYQKMHTEVQQASYLSAHERCRKLASAPKNPTIKQAVKHIAGRALDFSQARPELGHATNACAIVGRRAVSQGIFFDRRLFLISYDARDDDAEGSLLEALLLMAGPVGAGISLEYYFSKVSNNRFGAGSKVTHNVTGFFGVMEGANSDLRTGLPKQMIEIHEAMRLQVMVEASTDVLTKIYQRAPALQELIANEWILLSSIDPDTGEIHAFNPKKGFVSWSNQDMPSLATVRKSVDWYSGKMEPLWPVFIQQEEQTNG